MALTEVEQLDLLADLIKNSVQEQLLVQRPSLGYDGQPKGDSSRFGVKYNNRRNTGFLYKNVNVYYKETPNGDLQMVIDFGQADYWRWVDQGRRGTDQLASLKYPPLAQILAWTKQRGLPQFRDERGRFISDLQRAYMIRTSIGKHGIYKTDFVQKGIDSVLQDVELRLSQWAEDFLNKLLEEKNIIVKSQFLV